MGIRSDYAVGMKQMLETGGTYRVVMRCGAAGSGEPGGAGDGEAACVKADRAHRPRQDLPHRRRGRPHLRPKTGDRCLSVKRGKPHLPICSWPSER